MSAASKKKRSATENRFEDDINDADSEEQDDGEEAEMDFGMLANPSSSRSSSSNSVSGRKSHPLKVARSDNPKVGRGGGRGGGSSSSSSSSSSRGGRR